MDYKKKSKPRKSSIYCCCCYSLTLIRRINISFSIQSVVDIVIILMSAITRMKNGLFGQTKPRNPHSLESLK